MKRPIPATPHHDQPGPSPFVIGTAGHVDHGKSTLVRRLTGIDPDRLEEEQRREMTIDLGFAWFTLPTGRSVSIIDVPGHERFIRNMLAGVGGIDLALLVIAADDGPMPQTREHLAILDLLGIRNGVVALSRVDLVDDEWRELVVEEVRDLLDGSTLANSRIVPVSAITGEGMEELVAVIDGTLSEAQSRDATGRPRLPVDRSFQVPGFGTVVTGTLTGGEIAVGEELRLYPHGREVRVRGIQTHEHAVERVRAGTRVALNLVGVDHREVRRGNVLAPAGVLTPSLRLDARIEIIADAPVILEPNDEVIAFVGAAEVPARVTLLDRDAIGPGEEGWVQLRLAHELAVLRGDRVVLRRPSPAATIGGGVVVDPVPPRHKRFRQEVLASLAVMAEGTPDDLVNQTLADRAMMMSDLEQEAGIAELQHVVATMVREGHLVVLGIDREAPLNPRSVVLRTTVLDALLSRARSTLATHHARYPLQPGLRRDDLRLSLGVESPRIFDQLVVEFQRRGAIENHGSMVTAPGFAIRLQPEQRNLADSFIRAARDDEASPPAPGTFDVPADLVAALAALGEVVAVSDQIVYPRDVFEHIKAQVIAKLERDSTISLAEYRDLFGTSRKYAQPTLEYLDQLRITRRKGDVRVRFRGTGAGS
jgi:selenocysteine-specific elongation factor